MLAIAATVNAYKILVLVPANEETNWNFMQIIIDELINRGHEITCITSQTATFGFLRIQQNYTEILIDPPFEVQPNSVRKYLCLIFFFLLLLLVFIRDDWRK